MVLIDDVELNLSTPIHKYWYSKYKKNILRNNICYVQYVLSDAKQKRKIQYTPRYYACAKFIQATTHLRFVKQSNDIDYVKIFDYDFVDKYIVKYNVDFDCINQMSPRNRMAVIKGTEINSYDENQCDSWTGGKKRGECKNGCCEFYRKKNKRFYIQWI